MLNRELLIGAGDMDLDAQDAQGRYVVVELKRAKATQEAVHQLSKYVDAVRGLLPVTAVVRGILAAPAISPPAALTLERLQLEFREPHALPSARETAAQPLLFQSACTGTRTRGPAATSQTAQGNITG